MFRILSILSLIFGSTLSQINPIRDPSLTIPPTIGPIVTARPIRTIGPLLTTISNTLSTTTTNITSTTTSTITNTTQINNSDNQEESINMELVYILAPTLGTILLCCVPYFFCRKKKEPLQNVNNNVVNIDLNIENVIPKINERQVSKQSSNNSERFVNHIYEEVDYEARYEMPCLNNSENVYGRQVTTIV